MLSATAMIRHVNKHIWAGFAATACLAVAAMSAQNNRPPAPPGVTGSPTAPTSQARNTPNVGSLAQVSKAPLGLNEDLPAGRQNVAANPISYRGRNGKQYVAIVANSQLVAFTLP